MFNLEEVLHNFKVIPSNMANSVLLANMDNSGQKKILYVFAGPNGSGKSTLIANMYMQSKFKNVKYINADIYANILFSDIRDEREKNLQAMKYAVDNINCMKIFQDSVIYETVLSHPSKIDLIHKYKEYGYQIYSIFITTNNPDINLERIAQRVSEGGHNVPAQKVIDRFYRSNKLKQCLKEISDVYYEIDNTEIPKIINTSIKNHILEDEIQI